MTLLAAFLLGLAQEPPDKAYEFVPPPGIEVGDVFQFTMDENEENWVTLYNGTSMLYARKTGKRYLFDATQKILEPDEDASRALWTFTQAIEAKNSIKKPLPFSGKTVLATVREGTFKFEYEDGRWIGIEADKAIRRPTLGLTNREPSKERNTSYDDFYAPGRGMKVGERWPLPIASVARMIGGSELAWSIDDKSCKATAELASVEKRGKSLIGVIKTDVDLAVSRIDKLELVKPISMKMTIEQTGAIDGSRPDSKVVVKLSFKGTSAVKDPANRPIRIEFDSVNERTMTRKQVTQE